MLPGLVPRQVEQTAFSASPRLRPFEKNHVVVCKADPEDSRAPLKLDFTRDTVSVGRVFLHAARLSIYPEQSAVVFRMTIHDPATINGRRQAHP